MRPLLVAAALAFAPGCATTLSQLQTATPARRGQVQVTGGAGVYIPVGPVAIAVKQGVEQGRAIKEAKDTGAEYELTEEAQQELLTAGLALAIMPPSQTYEIGLRTGILREDLDLGFRYSMNAVRLDTKYRFFHWSKNEHLQPHRRMNLDLAVGAGVSRYIFKNGAWYSPVFEVLEYVRLDNFSRWDVEAPLYATLDFGDIFKLYGGMKYVYSRTSLDTNLVNYSQHATVISGLELGVPRTVHTHFIGGTVGIAAGYRWAHLMLELTGGYTHCKPLLFGRYRQLGGATFYPAVGIGLKFP